jgi:hypothetical protein
MTLARPQEGLVSLLLGVACTDVADVVRCDHVWSRVTEDHDISGDESIGSSCARVLLTQKVSTHADAVDIETLNKKCWERVWGSSQVVVPLPTGRSGACVVAVTSIVLHSVIFVRRTSSFKHSQRHAQRRQSYVSVDCCRVRRSYSVFSTVVGVLRCDRGSC